MLPVTLISPLVNILPPVMFPVALTVLENVVGANTLTVVLAVLPMLITVFEILLTVARFNVLVKVVLPVALGQKFIVCVSAVPPKFNVAEL